MVYTDAPVPKGQTHSHVGVMALTRTVEMTFEGTSDFNPDWDIPRFRLMIKSDPSRPCGNFHLFMRPPTKVEGLVQMMPVSANLVEQTARGRVTRA